MGYGYGVLNNWHPERNEDWWEHGPFCEVRAERYNHHQPWDVRVKVYLCFLDGYRKEVWVQLEHLNRSLWMERREFTNECAGSHKQRFEWERRNIFRQAMMP